MEGVYWCGYAKLIKIDGDVIRSQHLDASRQDFECDGLTARGVVDFSALEALEKGDLLVRRNMKTQ